MSSISFDLSSIYDEKTNLKLSYLCSDILETCHTDKESLTVETIRARLKNDHGTGLINRIERDLHFPIQMIAAKSKKDLFDEYKLLKFLYQIENTGISCISDKEKSIPQIAIVNFLNKPTLENVNTAFAKRNHHGNIIDNLLESLMPYVTEPQKRMEDIQRISTEWDKLVGQLMNYGVSDHMINGFPDTLIWLISVQNILTTKISPIFNNYPTEKCIPREGVMDTFFNFLLGYYFRCNECNRIGKQWEVPCVHPDKAYIKEYNEYGLYDISWSILENYKKSLNKSSDISNDANSFARIVLYNREPNSDDISMIMYAIEHAQSYARLVESAKIDDEGKHYDFSKNINLGLLIAIVQEICYIKKNKIKIANPYFGYTNKQQSLRQAFASEDNQTPLRNQVLIKRLENRIAINTGGANYIHILRNIEKQLFEIKKNIFLYQNTEDMIFVNSCIFRLVECMLAEYKMFDNALYDICHSLKEYFKNKI